jgi:hypothetical protein
LSHVFISHANEDSEYALQLAEHSEKWGFSVWIDINEINTGDRWMTKIEESISACSALIVIMTPEAKKSEYVEAEILLAKELGKPILPILLRGEAFPILSTRQFYDVRKDRDRFDNMPKPEFFVVLKKSAPSAWRDLLTPEQRSSIKNHRFQFVAQELSPEEETESSPADPTIYTEIVKWTKALKATPNDFYAMTMLAIAYQAEGTLASHRDALICIKKACRLEPRIRNKQWMTAQFSWTEREHTLLEQLLTDPDFQDHLTHGLPPF